MDFEVAALDVGVKNYYLGQFIQEYHPSPEVLELCSDEWDDYDREHFILRNLAMSDLLIARGIKDLSFLKPVQEADSMIEKLHECFESYSCWKYKRGFLNCSESLVPFI